MSREPKPFVFTLTDEEIKEIADAVGSGGQQQLHRRLTAELEKGREVTFNDTQLGELVRYMTQYGSGGFQGRLRRAFIRSLCEQVGAKPI